MMFSAARSLPAFQKCITSACVSRGVRVAAFAWCADTGTLIACAAIRTSAAIAATPAATKARLFDNKRRILSPHRPGRLPAARIGRGEEILDDLNLIDRAAGRGRRQERRRLFERHGLREQVALPNRTAFRQQ